MRYEAAGWGAESDRLITIAISFQGEGSFESNSLVAHTVPEREHGTCHVLTLLHCQWFQYLRSDEDEELFFVLLV